MVLTATARRARSPLALAGAAISVLCIFVLPLRAILQQRAPIYRPVARVNPNRCRFSPSYALTIEMEKPSHPFSPTVCNAVLSNRSVAAIRSRNQIGKVSIDGGPFGNIGMGIVRFSRVQGRGATVSAALEVERYSNVKAFDAKPAPRRIRHQ
jgi:hypothetical protein